MSEEIKKLVDEVNSGIAAIKTEVDGVKSEVAKSGEFGVKLDRIADQVSKAAEQIQANQQKQAALEAALNRIGANGQVKGSSEALIEESKAAFKAYARGGADAVKGMKFKIGSDGLELRSMSTDVNPDGGYLVLPELANFVADRVFESSPIRSIARVLQTSAKSMEVIVDDNEAGSGWEDEQSTQGETDTPEFGKLTINTHKLAAEPRVTDEMLADSFMDIEAWLQGKVTDKFSRDENTAFVNGASVKRPQGFLTLSAWAAAGVYERNKLEQINLGGASALTGDGLISLQAALKEEYQGNAKFVMSRSTFGAALKLKGADNYFFSPSLLRDGQSTMTLLGKPVIFASDMPEVASNALSIAYGDFARAYTILDRVGLTMLRDPYTVKGVVKFYFTKRVGGAVTSFDALKIGKIAA